MSITYEYIVYFLSVSGTIARAGKRVRKISLSRHLLQGRARAVNKIKRGAHSGRQLISLRMYIQGVDFNRGLTFFV